MKIQLEENATLPLGFKAAGVHAGIKKEAKDMALISSDVVATAAGVFTTNQVCAAPVKICRKHLTDGQAKAIVMNSGNANACTGAEGLAHAEAMCVETASQLNCDPSEVLVCSTGSIGKPLELEPIVKGISLAADVLASDQGMAAAEAMMTTDLVSKTITTTLSIDGKTVRITGMAKGSGMIEPNMATMLAYILTDASVPSDALQSALSAANAQSFNRISVDGDTSTNDSVLLLANGAADTAALNPSHSDWSVFCEALNAVCLDLALKIVRDGEGASHLITLQVTGAQSDSEADQAARAVANSMLVKTGWAGSYPVWGRIMDVLGYCSAHVEEEKISIDYNELPITRSGQVADSSPESVLAITQEPEYTIHIDLGLGAGSATIYTCDCTEEYVRINL